MRPGRVRGGCRDRAIIRWGDQPGRNVLAFRPGDPVPPDPCPMTCDCSRQSYRCSSRHHHIGGYHRP